MGEVGPMATHAKKRRKPRRLKQNGQPSFDLCPHCYAFDCDPLTMSPKFAAKIRGRLRRGVCAACGQAPCICKSSRYAR